MRALETKHNFTLSVVVLPIVLPMVLPSSSCSSDQLLPLYLRILQ